MALSDIFGFRFKGKDEGEIPSVVPPTNNDGSLIVQQDVVAGGWQGFAYDPDATVKTETEQIIRYRQLQNVPEIDYAIDDIVNEMIVTDQDDYPVALQLDNLKVSEPIKKKFQDCFKEVLSLLNFNQDGHDLVRSWYVDGRQYFHILFKNNDVKQGIAEIRPMDSLKTKKVKNYIKKRNDKGVEVVERIEEYFIYNDKGVVENNISGVKLSVDSVAFVHSGLMDNGVLIGHLHKAIKPANQLRMLEDAVVIYTLTRAPDRRVFYIDVGNLPKIKAEQYVTEVMNKFKNKLVYNASTGEIADSKKHMCLAMDTLVPLLDGRTLTLSQIAEEKSLGKELWAYSADPITGKFAPGLITWAGVARKDSEVMRITLDNGKEIVCTLDHKFPVWGKGMVPAAQLVVGESMIPHYTREENISGREYQQIYNNDTQNWQFTHRAVSQWKDSVGLLNEAYHDEKHSGSEKRTVHHKNFSRFDNTPDNLVRMNKEDHILLHSANGRIAGSKLKLEGKGIFALTTEERSLNGKKGGSTSAAHGESSKNYAKARAALKVLIQEEDWNAEFREKQRAGWTSEKKAVASKNAKENGLSNKGNATIKELSKDPEWIKKRSDMYKTEYTQEMLNFYEILVGNLCSAKDAIIQFNSSNLLTAWAALNSKKAVSKKSKTYTSFVAEDLNRIANIFGFANHTEALDSVHYRNHKIAKIEILEERIDTGCLTIDGNEIYHNYHTFALDAGIYTGNSMIEDFWMARRDNGKATEITTLQGSQSLIQVDFVEYFRDKLYQALNVPKSRFQQGTGFSIGRSSEVTRDEVKFNKFIGKLRIKYSTLFLDLLKIQLVAKGIIRLDEWEQIKEKIRFDFQKDNYFAELKDSEIINNRVQSLAAVDPYLGKYYSKKWIQKNVLRLNDEEIKEIDSDIKEEGEDALPSEITNQMAMMQVQQQMQPAPEQNEEPQEQRNEQYPYQRSN